MYQGQCISLFSCEFSHSDIKNVFRYKSKFIQISYAGFYRITVSFAQKNRKRNILRFHSRLFLLELVKNVIKMFNHTEVVLFLVLNKVKSFLKGKTKCDCENGVSGFLKVFLHEYKLT